MRRSERKQTAGLLVSMSLLLSACNATSDGLVSSFGNTPAAIDLPATVQAFPDDQVLPVAKAQFAAGNYGHAARYYERAVELAANDAEAWLGLAASYDRVRRFDLADRAYSQAARYAADRPEYYNNIGYSYLLRGDVVKARVNFLKAYDLDPTSVTVNNNLELLRENAARARPN